MSGFRIVRPRPIDFIIECSNSVDNTTISAHCDYRPRILQFTCHRSNLNLFLAETTTKTAKEVAMTERRELSAQEISDRAYELYLQRGGEPGKDVEDWVRAEKELGADAVVAERKTKAARLGHNSN